MSNLVLAAMVCLSFHAAQPLWPDLSTMPAATGGGEKDAAVVVAVEDYAYLPDVAGAGEMGVAWYLYLSKVRRVPMVMLLKDADATPTKIRNAMTETSSRVGKGGRVWFVFIGHGAPAQDGMDGVLVGATAQADQYEFFPHTIARAEVAEQLAPRSPGILPPVLIVDACFSGTDVQGKTLIKGAQFAVSQEWAKSADVTLLTAGRAQDIAGQLPGSNRPAFSYLVLGALRGWGDANGDGQVTAFEAVQYAKDALLTLDSGRQQSPQHAGKDQVLTGFGVRGSGEPGPDLAGIKVMLAGGSGGSQSELDRQLAELQNAKKAREEAERQEAELRAAATKRHREEVDEKWKKVLVLAKEGGPEAQQALELFLKSYEGHPLGNPREKEARELLQGVGPNEATDEFAGQLAELEKARKQREEAEKRESAVLEKAKRERELAQMKEKEARKAAEDAARKAVAEREAREAEELRLAQQKHAQEVDRVWNAVASVAAGGGAEGARALELFLERYRGHPLGNPREAQALAMLERLRQVAVAETRGFVTVQPGCFLMGSPPDEEGRDPDEHQHKVCLTRSFLIKRTEVTVKEWRELMKTSPPVTGACGDSCPVQNVSWWDALAYCNELSKSEGLEPCYVLAGCDGRTGTTFECQQVDFKGLACPGYRLPTEAEWEYASRAGEPQPPSGEKPRLAWFETNSGGAAQTVAQMLPNAWGLHDMMGNVWEWCWDLHGEYGAGSRDPLGAKAGTGRVNRGGSWFNPARQIRLANRNSYSPGTRSSNLGFRPVRTH